MQKNGWAMQAVRSSEESNANSTKDDSLLGSPSSFSPVVYLLHYLLLFKTCIEVQQQT